MNEPRRGLLLGVLERPLHNNLPTSDMPIDGETPKNSNSPIHNPQITRCMQSRLNVSLHILDIRFQFTLPSMWIYFIFFGTQRLEILFIATRLWRGNSRSTR